MPGNTIVLAAISAAAGLGGALLGGWFTYRGQKIERRQRFIRERLSEFYAPMLGYRERLKASGDVRSKVRDATSAAWPRLVERAREMGADAGHELQEERWPEFENVIDYDNRKLKEIDIPMYRQMLDLFT